MKTTNLAGVCFPVSKICLGTAFFGTRESEETAYAILDHYFEKGGRFFNTAHEYGLGKSETVLGNWIRTRGVRDQIVVTTKGGEDIFSRETHYAAMHHDDLLQDMDESLARLGIDHVDFYMIHLDDPTVSPAEILETLEELKKAGKLLHYGCSNWSVQRQQEAADYAKAHGLEGFLLDENEFNLAYNTPERHICCTAVDTAYVAFYEKENRNLAGYSPLAGGTLTKLVKDGDNRNWHPECLGWYSNEYTYEVGRRLKKLCEETGWSPTQIQLSWLLNPPYRFSSFLIIGASKPAQLDDALQALDLQLTPEMTAFLRPKLEDYPKIYR